MPDSKTQFLPQQVPAAQGYRMPAEWEPHEATWLAWPHNEETWPGQRLREVEGIYLTMLEALLASERVHLLVQDAREEEAVLACIKRSGTQHLKNLLLHKRRSVDSWIRDYGPTFLVNRQGSKAWCKWIFNAWGGRYPSLAEDTHVFEEARDLVPLPCFRADFILEGGSIEVNGEGLCLTSEQCLLHKNRNPGLSPERIEENLKNYLGVEEILWLREGIAGDDTDGHVDDIARFAAPKVILAAFEDDPCDANHGHLKENWEILRRASLGDVKRWDLVKLPMPGAVLDEGVRLPASYANFYVANEVVLIPIYRCKNDERAVKILKELFPHRVILPIECRALVFGLGAIHCVTQQEPA